MSDEINYSQSFEKAIQAGEPITFRIKSTVEKSGFGWYSHAKSINGLIKRGSVFLQPLYDFMSTADAFGGRCIATLRGLLYRIFAHHTRMTPLIHYEKTTDKSSPVMVIQFLNIEPRLSDEPPVYEFVVSPDGVKSETHVTCQ